jgi:hypothetical protein
MVDIAIVDGCINQIVRCITYRVYIYIHVHQCRCIYPNITTLNKYNLLFLQKCVLNQGLESFLTCLVHIALCIQNLHLASPAKPETAPPTAPPAPLPAASQAAEAAAEVGKGKAES